MLVRFCCCDRFIFLVLSFSRFFLFVAPVQCINSTRLNLFLSSRRRLLGISFFLSLTVFTEPLFLLSSASLSLLFRLGAKSYDPAVLTLGPPLLK